MVHINSNFARVHPLGVDSHEGTRGAERQGTPSGVRFAGPASTGASSAAQGHRSTKGRIADAFRSVDPSKIAARFERLGNKSPELKAKLSWMGKKASVATQGIEERLKTRMGELFGKHQSSGHSMKEAFARLNELAHHAGRNFREALSDAGGRITPERIASMSSEQWAKFKAALKRPAQHSGSPQAGGMATHAQSAAPHASASAYAMRDGGAAASAAAEAKALRAMILGELEQLPPGSAALKESIALYESLVKKPPEEALPVLKQFHAAFAESRVKPAAAEAPRPAPARPRTENAPAGGPAARPAQSWAPRPSMQNAAHRPAPQPSPRPTSFAAPRPQSSHSSAAGHRPATTPRPTETPRPTAASRPTTAGRPTVAPRPTNASRPAPSRPAPQRTQPSMDKADFMAALQRDREREAEYMGTHAYMGDAEEKWQIYASAQQRAESQSHVSAHATHSAPHDAKAHAKAKKKFMKALEEDRHAEARYMGTEVYMGDAEEKWQAHVREQRQASRPAPAPTRPAEPPRASPAAEPPLDRHQFMEQLEAERNAEAEYTGFQASMHDAEEQYQAYLARFKG